ncbi:MAG: ATP-dependent helicase [Planctomycetota bacterium]
MDLNEQQRAAAEFDGQHCLVLAGAGTGKTTTIMARVLHLVRSGVSPQRIVLMTFTRRAAREMRQRLGKNKKGGGGEAKKVPAGTFHQFCLSYLRRWPDAFGTAGLSIIDRDDQTQLMKLAVGRRPDNAPPLPKPAKLVNYLSYARNTNQSVKQYLGTFTDLDDAGIDDAASVMGVYSERKRECRYLDYDDILHVFATAIHRDAALRNKIASRMDHLLVDEMQDTNPLQWLILDGLRDPAKLFCVGDDAQSIYAFRGADFENVHHFTQRVEDSTVLRLEQNYRSTQPILDLSNWLLKQSDLKYDKKLVSSRGDGIVPELIDFDSEFEEGDWIAEDIRQRHEGGADYRKHMILTRTAYAAKSVEAALIELDIPYRFVGGTALLRSAHVRDLLAVLRVVTNRADELAWIRYLTLWPRIGDKTAAKFVTQVTQAANLAEALDWLQSRTQDRPGLVQTLRQTDAHRDRPAAAIEAASEGLSEILETRYDNWENRSRDFKLLQRLAQSHESIELFIETYTLDPVTESEVSHDDTEDIVTLITVHSAKGTEAPVCYLIGAGAGNYPHSRSVGDPKAEEEERRVLYVAMTRAMDELILTRTIRVQGAWVPHWHRTEAAGGETSYFLNKVPSELVRSDGFGSTGDFDSPIIPFRRR